MKENDEMIDRIKAYAERYGMFHESDHIIVGVSGGADSICLLCVLLKLKKLWGFQITAVHINHGLRGQDALADELYVKSFCEREQVPLVIYHKDVKMIAKKRGLSCEEAGREARREAYVDALEKWKGTKIALAHHMNDNAETLLLNIARGTGLKGLSAIRPVNGRYIRPLLCVTRCEIEEYLNKNHIAYCIDATNLEKTYTRNRIRNDVLPYLEEEINDRAVLHMLELTRQMQELGEYVERQVSEAFARCVRKEEGEYVLYLSQFSKIDGGLKPYLIRRLLVCASGKEKDIESMHVKALEELTRKQSGKRINLPYGLYAVRSFDKVYISHGSGIVKSIGEGVDASDVHFRIFECEKMPAAFPKTPYTKWFDYDIIKNSVTVRTRCPGDYITIDREGNTQKLKNYFINMKIPREKRDRILLVADGSHIMWVVGYRQSQKYQVSERTRRVLEIRVDGGEEDGRND